MKLASLIKEQIDIGDVLYSKRDQIELDFGPRTFKALQSSLMMDDEAYVRSWLIKNGYMEEEKMPFEEDTEPTAEDPLGLGGELGTGTENPTMQSYGNYDVLNRLAKARQSALDLPSRLAKIKDTKVKSVITRIIPEFNNVFKKINAKDPDQKNDISAGVNVIVDFIIKSDPKKKNFDSEVEKAKTKVLEFIKKLKMSGSAQRTNEQKNKLRIAFEKLVNDLLKSKDRGELRLEGKVCESCGKIHEGSCGYTHTVNGRRLKTPGGTRGGVEEIKLSDLVTDKQKRDAEEFATKTKQVAAKAGEEMINFAKDVYDTPTVKRLRAYVKKEISKLAQKLVDKYGYEKQMKIPFPEDEIEESLRNWFKKEKWVRIDTQGNIAGKCGTMPKGKATQRCLPRAKAQSLTKKQRAATARKKVRGSKKGKQFVRNTKKATVRLKKK